MAELLMLRERRSNKTVAHLSSSRDSSVGRAEDCSGIKSVILRSLVRIRLAGLFSLNCSKRLYPVT